MVNKQHHTKHSGDFDPHKNSGSPDEQIHLQSSKLFSLYLKEAWIGFMSYFAHFIEYLFCLNFAFNAVRS